MRKLDPSDIAILLGDYPPVSGDAGASSPAPAVASLSPIAGAGEVRRILQLADRLSRAWLIVIDDGFSKDGLSPGDVQLIVDALKARATSVTDGSGPDTENARA